MSSSIPTGGAAAGSVQEIIALRRQLGCLLDDRVRILVAQEDEGDCCHAAVRGSGGVTLSA